MDSITASGRKSYELRKSYKEIQCSSYIALVIVMRFVTLYTAMLAQRTGTIRGGSFLSLLLAQLPVRRWRLLNGPPYASP
ncbi:MAG: hypothetical protein J4G05_07465 [Chlorobi bacterium]|nr:hypothetical protein [Chlorobiota bacterium]